MSIKNMVHQLMEGVEDLATFAAIFIFGMIFIGEIYGVYTFKTLASQGWKSPFYYPIYAAVALLLVRIIDDILEKNK